MNKALVRSLTWAGVTLVLTLCAIVANRLGYIDRDIVIRLVIGINGLMIASYGNSLPKTMVPVPANAVQARRVASWSLVLSGLVYTGLWAFAPIPVAAWGGTGAILAGMAVTLGYCLSLRGKEKTAG
jgi:hypothetical protein